MCRIRQDCLFLKKSPSYMLWQTWMALSLARVLVGSMTGIEYPLHSFLQKYCTGWAIVWIAYNKKRRTPYTRNTSWLWLRAKTSPLFLHIYYLLYSSPYGFLKKCHAWCFMYCATSTSHPVAKCLQFRSAIGNSDRCGTGGLLWDDSQFFHHSK